MTELVLLFVALAAGLWGVVYAVRRRRDAERTLDRLYAQPTAEVVDVPRRTRGPFARRHLWLCGLFATTVGAVLYFAAGWSVAFSVAFAFLSLLVAVQVDSMVYQRRHDRIERQLADALDLAVASLKVGSSLQQALSYAAEESPRPLSEELSHLVARIRLGDPADEVFEGLTDRVPLETFRLFTTSLVVNWDTGGSLVAPLSMVGRTIRERIELTRRLRALSAQAKASVVGILLVTYFLAAVVWRNDPERMVAFLSSTVGQTLVAISIGLEGVGILWIGSLSRIRF